MLSPAPEAAAVHRHTVSSPIGALTLFQRRGALTDLIWAARQRIGPGAPTRLLAEAEAQLAAYFGGRLREFTLPLAPAGTDFQIAVWDAIAAVPFGTTRTYGGLAKILGSGPRYGARACAANPIPVIVPCHRIVGAGGKLHGYSGRGGTATKSVLLELEGVSANR